MALITAAVVAASFYHSKALVASLAILTVGTVVMTIGLLASSAVLQMIGGWCFVISAAFAWYNASVLMIANSYAKSRVRAQLKEAETINEGLGEPGVIHDNGSAIPKFMARRAVSE